MFKIKPIYQVIVTLIVFFFAINCARANVLNDIWGVAPPNSFYLGMWSVHFSKRGERRDNNTNDLIGIVYHSLFFGTLRNSWSTRMWAGGIQRNFFAIPFGNGFVYTLGYRAGLVSGYDGRMMKLADKTPVLPFAQLLTAIRYKHFAAEISYTGIVISGELFFAF
ncbi:MAG: hypothetical protein AAGG80_06160 [Pseudomonadota bacterium]